VVPRRLSRLPSIELPGGVRVHVARSFGARLAGLALLRSAPADRALLIPRCRSVHTFGMRFPIGLLFLDERGRVVRSVPAVPPGRVVRCRAAAAVVEYPSGGHGMMSAMAEGQRSKLAQALDPRVPIYRDAYNEYFVFVLSAGGAGAGTQVPLYIVMAITGIWNVGVFVAACVIFELGVIFGLARPQMTPRERIGWAAMWAFVTAVLAFCFWHLVASPTLD
jgi:uncharacterized membrane protein (UPF0127 family)